MIGRWLIQTATGRPPGYSTFDKKLKTACATAGIPPISSHGLRHTYVSWMLDDGHTADQVAMWIGDHHSTVREVYAHMLQASSAPAAESIEQALAGLNFLGLMD